MSISPRTEDLRDAGFHFGSTAPSERENTDGLVNGRELWLDFSGDVPVLRWLDDGGTWRAVSDGSGFGAAIPATVQTAVARTVVRTAEVAAAATVSGGEVEATIDTALARTVGRTTTTAAAAHVGDAVEAVITNAVARTVGRTVATEAAAQIAAVVAATVDTSLARTVARTVATSATATVSSEFDPLSIDWHAAFWADDPNWTDPGDGNAVSQWDDGSGNSRHATQATGSLQPTFRDAVASLNGHAGVEFDGSDDYLQTASFPQIDDADGTLQYFAVAQGTTGSVQGVVSGSESAARRNIFWFASGGGFGLLEDNIETGGSPDSNAHALFATFRPSTDPDTLDVDGTEVISEDLGQNILQDLVLGNVTALSAALDGPIGFLGLYEGTMTAQEEADLLAWSQSYYDTP